MNKRHSGVTDWGLSHVTIQPTDTILDAGCGGGRTVGKLAAAATSGKVYGIDFSSESVAVSKRNNSQLIEEGRVEIQQASVSELPFADSFFDLIVAVETHFWWPNLPGDTRELYRVLKPGGSVIIIAEVYRGGTSNHAQFIEKHLPKTGLKLLSIDEHRQLFEEAGFTEVETFTRPEKLWISVTGKKP